MKNPAELFNEGLEQLFAAKLRQKQLTGWFEYQEIRMREREAMRAAGRDPDEARHAGELLCRCVERMPLSIPAGSVFAGTQDDAFSPSYALINPGFQVESFAGYCDPVAIYADIEPSEAIPAERIEAVRNYYRETP